MQTLIAAHPFHPYSKGMKTQTWIFKILGICSVMVFGFAVNIAHAQDDYGRAPPMRNSNTAPKRIDLKKVKSEQSSEVQVVQNRLFKKVGRLRLGVFGGVVSTDPFLSVYHAGGKLGYSFTDLFGIQLFYGKDFSNPSSSEKQFNATTGFNTNANAPKSLYGIEALWAPIYGKLNVMNSSIIYFDFRGGLGVGQRATESGTNLAYMLNVGGDVFLSQHFVFELEYRLVGFKQKIVEKYNAPVGAVISTPFELSSIFTIGFGILF
jgi:outer membrane beta-barrel protein